tara:strand:- start:2814 stop:3476 length:663 start_codon:yes stop_codon:yes gene_type:complete
MAYGSIKVDKIITDNGSGTDIELTLPSAAPSAAGKVLKASSTPTTLEWADDSAETNLTATASGTALTVVSSSGTNVDLPAASTSAWGVMTDEDKTKLDGVAAGATVGVVATGGTFTGSVTFEDAINENVFAITDAASVALDPDNGLIQTWTLGASRNATDSLTSGQSMMLVVTASSNSITWPTIQWIGGSAPTLSSSGTTVIELWKISSTLYAATVGDPS